MRRADADSPTTGAVRSHPTVHMLGSLLFSPPLPLHNRARSGGNGDIPRTSPQNADTLISAHMPSVTCIPLPTPVVLHPLGRCMLPQNAPLPRSDTPVCSISLIAIPLQTSGSRAVFLRN